MFVKAVSCINTVFLFKNENGIFDQLKSLFNNGFLLNSCLTPVFETIVSVSVAKLLNTVDVLWDEDIFNPGIFPHDSFKTSISFKHVPPHKLA